MYFYFRFEQDMDGYQLSVVSTMFQHPDWKCFEVGPLSVQYTISLVKQFFYLG
jgi:hypothetical protein